MSTRSRPGFCMLVPCTIISLSLLGWTSECEESAVDSKEALVDSRATDCCKSPCGGQLSVGAAPTKDMKVNPLSFELISSCRRASSILTNSPKQRLWKKIFLKKLIFKLKKKSSYSKWPKSGLCWAALALFYNVVFFKQVAHEGPWNEVSVLRACGRKSSPVLLS